MSVKIYFGFACEARFLHRAMDRVYREMWANVEALARRDGVDTFEQCNSFVKSYAECGAHVFLDPKDSRTVYFILWGIPRFCEISRPKWLRDYCYWNNTDTMPDGVTRVEWKRRARTWDRLACRGESWEKRLTMIVLSKDTIGASRLFFRLHPERRRPFAPPRS